MSNVRQSQEFKKRSSTIIKVDKRDESNELSAPTSPNRVMTLQDKSQKSTEQAGLNQDSFKKAMDENFEKHLGEKISFISAQLMEQEEFSKIMNTRIEARIREIMKDEKAKLGEEAKRSLKELASSKGGIGLNIELETEAQSPDIIEKS